MQIRTFSSYLDEKDLFDTKISVVLLMLSFTFEVQLKQEIDKSQFTFDSCVRGLHAK